jgi:preprotein translocase subunit YajC
MKNNKIKVGDMIKDGDGYTGQVLKIEERGYKVKYPGATILIKKEGCVKILDDQEQSRLEMLKEAGFKAVGN